MQYRKDCKLQRVEIIKLSVQILGQSVLRSGERRETHKWKHGNFKDKFRQVGLKTSLTPRNHIYTPPEPTGTILNQTRSAVESPEEDLEILLHEKVASDSKLID